MDVEKAFGEVPSKGMEWSMRNNSFARSNCNSKDEPL